MGLKMHKTCIDDKPYSKRQLLELKGLFSCLEKAKYSESVNSYTEKVMAKIKA